MPHLPALARSSQRCSRTAGSNSRPHLLPRVTLEGKRNVPRADCYRELRPIYFVESVYAIHTVVMFCFKALLSCCINKQFTSPRLPSLPPLPAIPPQSYLMRSKEHIHPLNLGMGQPFTKRKAPCTRRL